MSDEMSGVDTLVDTASAGIDSTPSTDTAVAEPSVTETTTDSTVDSPSTGAETHEDEADLLDENGNARTKKKSRHSEQRKPMQLQGKHRCLRKSDAL
jgi:hypothetical protein